MQSINSSRLGFISVFICHCFSNKVYVQHDAFTNITRYTVNLFNKGIGSVSDISQCISVPFTSQMPKSVTFLSCDLLIPYLC